MDNQFALYDLTCKNTAKKYVQRLQQDFNNTERTQYLFAITLYKESYGLPLILKEALACTIINRIKNAQKDSKKITPDSIITDINFYPHLFDDVKIPNITDEEFALCSRLAGRALRDCVKDITHGATFFHHENDFPELVKNKGSITQIKDYLFYKL